MVTQAQRISSTSQKRPVVENQNFKWSTVSLSEILKAKNRLEASVYGIEGKQARQVISACQWPLLNLKNDFLKTASYPGRFKRMYVDDAVNGHPFLLPSQINEIKPEPTKFISKSQKINFDELTVKRNTILMTRSGTIGNCTLVSKAIEGSVFSDDVIRITPANVNDLGYIYTYLKSKIGSTLIQTNTYGAVISHIEPEHLAQVSIPNPPAILKQSIHDRIIRSFALRDESNDLIDQAQKLLCKELAFPVKRAKYLPHDELKAFAIKINDLDGRFDGSYHLPVASKTRAHIKKHAEKMLKLNDKTLVKEIILPGRFKRIYLEEGKGTIFIGGKQILELDPNHKKFLSVGHHAKRIKDELTLHQEMVLITCSGTIGKVAIVPKHWEGWTANQHVMRVVASDKKIAGYLYAWLSSEWAYPLIARFTYGAVVDEIDDRHVSEIEVPLLKNSAVQSEINQKVLLANEKRYQAYSFEQEALQIMDTQVFGLERAV